MKHLKKFDDFPHMEAMDLVPDPGFPNAFWGVYPPLANKFKLKPKREIKSTLKENNSFSRKLDRWLDRIIAFSYHF